MDPISETLPEPFALATPAGGNDLVQAVITKIPPNLDLAMGGFIDIRLAGAEDQPAGTGLLPGEPVATASTNTCTVLPPGYTTIKTWQENEGILEVLEAQGILVDTGLRQRAGYTEAAIVRLLQGPEVAREPAEMSRESLEAAVHLLAAAADFKAPEAVDVLATGGWPEESVLAALTDAPSPGPGL